MISRVELKVNYLQENKKDLSLHIEKIARGDDFITYPYLKQEIQKGLGPCLWRGLL